MYRDLYVFALSEAGFSSWLEPARPALTLMIDLDGAISVGHEQLPDSWFGGLTSTYALVGFGDVAGKYYVPKLGPFVIYTMMIVILIWRPHGLFGRAAAR